MSAVLHYDEEASRRVEAMYSTPDVVAVRQHVLRALALQPGERVLDVGSGPGFLAGRWQWQSRLVDQCAGLMSVKRCSAWHARGQATSRQRLLSCMSSQMRGGFPFRTIPSMLRSR